MEAGKLQQDEDKPFCVELRERTKVAHDFSDKLINLKLAVVLTDINLYAEVLYQFYNVYNTLENALVQYSDHPHVGPLVLRQLFRAKAFEEDLYFYLGEPWTSKVLPLYPQTIAYCDRITDVASRNPTLLIA